MRVGESVLLLDKSWEGEGAFFHPNVWKSSKHSIKVVKKVIQLGFFSKERTLKTISSETLFE